MLLVLLHVTVCLRPPGSDISYFSLFIKWIIVHPPWLAKQITRIANNTQL